MTFKKFFWGITSLIFLPLIISCSGSDSSDNDNQKQEGITNSMNEGNRTDENLITLTEQEKSEGWELLFDGEDLQKWRSVKSETFPSDAWVIEEGSLVLAERGGDIVTREKYGDFELAWDFKLTHGANSGIKYFVDSITNKSNGNVVINGPEYQIIDDLNHDEIKKDPNGLSSTGALYLLYAPENKTLNPADQWNHARIIAKGNQVEHWLNGTKVVSYQRGSKGFMDKMEETKFKDYPDYGQIPEGHILLTDHHDKVFFRNIRIRRL
ncbi:MAG: DUF1080 domain-containing protein [Anditalea sp.]